MFDESILHLTPAQSLKFASLTHSLQPNCMVSGRIFNRQEDFQLCGDNEILTIRLPKEKEDPNLTVVAVDPTSRQPFLPADVVRLTPDQPVTLIATNGLPWHRIVGQDYYSQHQEIVAREWNLWPTETRDWTVVVHRASGGDVGGYLLTADQVCQQFILPASGGAVTKECARLRLPSGKPIRFKLQSVSPGAELADKNIRLELIPAKRLGDRSMER